MRAVREWNDDQYSYEYLLRELSFAKKDNARRIVNTIFCDAEHSEQLFKNPQALWTCLKRFGSSIFLADFLLRCCEAPWFHEGFQCFAFFCEKDKNNSVLTDALLEIHTLMEQKKNVYDSTVEKIMNALSSEKSAQIILQSFVKDDPQKDIPTACHENLRILTSFFSKTQMVLALKALNETKNWQDSALYRFVLMLLHVHQPTLFQNQEYRLSQKTAWQVDELKEAILFVRRYANTGNQHDPKQTILDNLLNALVLRAANAGLVGLLYRKNQSIDSNIAYFALKKRPVSRMECIKRKLFSKSQNVPTEKETELMIDWESLENEAFDLNQQQPMPLFKAFLMHYTGSRIKIEQLLSQLLNEKNTIKRNEVIHHLSEVMTALANRDIGKVVFHNLENRVINQPDLITMSLFSHMASYFGVRHQKSTKDSPRELMMLGLIKHFGQKKQYACVEKCCNLMLEHCIVDTSPRCARFKKTLLHIKKEAQVEESLKPLLDSWYFSIVQFFKRHWHGTKSNPSMYVKYCDAAQSYHVSEKLPDKITTDYVSGQEIYKQLKLYNNLPNLRNMKVRLEDMKEPDPQPKNHPTQKMNSEKSLHFFQEEDVANERKYHKMNT